MFLITKKANFELPGVAAFVENLPTGFFADGPITVARAPGRLDVIGGIADYSGSHVLEMPVAEAVCAAVQKRVDGKLVIRSAGKTERNFEMPLGDFFDGDALISYDAACAYFKRNDWAAYVAGVFHVLMREKSVIFDVGANIFIDSKVPEGKGVSSSAALEAAVMNAVAAAFEIEIEPREMAILCQKVENLVVGAPCGIMDQMSVICGRQNELMSMVCQPAELLAPVGIPSEIGFWGIDSGIRHSVGGGDYGSVRTGAFIGYRIIAELANIAVGNDQRWHGFLANLTPEEFEKEFRAHLPKKIAGAEFIAKFGGITDKVTRVDPAKTYDVINPTAHPVYENARVREFGKLLAETTTEETLTRLGKLMYAAHESYSACGLGSDGTDLIVELVKKQGAANGVYGAKITGGGSGGTVAVLGRRDAGPVIRQIAADYQTQTGHEPHVFESSSPGAAEFGTLVAQSLMSSGS